MASHQREKRPRDDDEVVDRIEMLYHCYVASKYYGKMLDSIVTLVFRPEEEKVVEESANLQFFSTSRYANVIKENADLANQLVQSQLYSTLTTS
ncbi:Exportin-2 [Bienertia sinuspersici]